MNRDFWKMMTANGYRLKHREVSGLICITAPTGEVVVQHSTVEDAIVSLETWFRGSMGIGGARI